PQALLDYSLSLHDALPISKGKFVESVVQFSQAPGEVELVSTKHLEIKSPADFRGKSLGVTGLGSSTNFLTQYLAVKNGVKLGELDRKSTRSELQSPDHLVC